MHLRLKITVLIVVMFLAGCATGTRHVDIFPLAYTNDQSSEGLIYIGSIVDKRRFEDKPGDPSTPSVKGDLSQTPKEKLSTLIGRQRGGFGAALGDVVLPQGGTVQEEVRELLIEGLKSRGYTVSDDKMAPITLDVDIEQFWAWFTPGMWSVSFEAKINCSLNFAKADGHKEFTITGYGINKGQIGRNANWALAYQRAFLDFLTNLDKTLDDASL